MKRIPIWVWIAAPLTAGIVLYFLLRKRNIYGQDVNYKPPPPNSTGIPLAPGYIPGYIDWADRGVAGPKLK